MCRLICSVYPKALSKQNLEQGFMRAGIWPCTFEAIPKSKIFPSDVAPRPPVDAAPRPPVDAAPRPPVDAAPRPADGAVDLVQQPDEPDIIDNTEPSQLMFHPRRQLPPATALPPRILNDGSMPLYTEDMETATEGSEAATPRPAADDATPRPADAATPRPADDATPRPADAAIPQAHGVHAICGICKSEFFNTDLYIAHTMTPCEFFAVREAPLLAVRRRRPVRRRNDIHAIIAGRELTNPQVREAVRVH